MITNMSVLSHLLAETMPEADGGGLANLYEGLQLQCVS